ncbi:MAG TPA: hypothetical protein VH092_14870, partial [Urbifossiella sp.]|nr:hypothetical protein [Urbifossiella sp.]
LVYLNALNLLPLVPLDGGRFFQVLLLARRPTATGWVRLLTVVGFGVWAWGSGGWFLWVVAGFLLLLTPMATLQARAAAAFRAAHPTAARRADELTDDQLAEIVTLIRLPRQTEPRKLSLVADWVREVHGQAVRERAGVPSVAALVGAYATACVVALAAATMLSAPVELPDDPPGGRSRPVTRAGRVFLTGWTGSNRILNNLHPV